MHRWAKTDEFLHIQVTILEQILRKAQYEAVQYFRYQGLLKNKLNLAERNIDNHNIIDIET